MVDELLLAINPEYSVGSNLTFSAADLYLENNNINHNIVYIPVLHYSLSHRNISSIFATHAQSIPNDRMHARYCATRNDYYIYQTIVNT